MSDVFSRRAGEIDPAGKFFYGGLFTRRGSDNVGFSG